jgi:hypothetical protein
MKRLRQTNGVVRYDVGSIGGHSGYDLASKVHDDGGGEEDLSTSTNEATDSLLVWKAALPSKLFEEKEDTTNNVEKEPQYLVVTKVCTYRCLNIHFALELDNTKFSDGTASKKIARQYT